MWLKLILRNLMAHPWRTFLTTGSLVLAVVLLCFLRATVTTMQSTIKDASTDRLWVQSAISLYIDLPLSYENKIKAVEGVEDVCKFQWFGGIYQDPSKFFAQFGVDAEKLLDSYPEMEIVEGSNENFLANRVGCVVGKSLADDYEFEIGKTIELIGAIFGRVDGKPWEFTVEAIYESDSAVIDERTLYFHYDYLKEAIEAGDVFSEPGVGVYLIRMKDSSKFLEIGREVDQLFANGPVRTETTTEAEFNRQFLTMLGNVPLFLQWIGGAVVFAILFAVLNTMLMAGRERTRDIGIMKALGFSDGSMFRNLMWESLILSAIGGGLGLVIVKASESVLQNMMKAQFPAFAIDNESMVMALVISLGIGLIAGLAPGLRAGRLLPVQALREEG